MTLTEIFKKIETEEIPFVDLKVVDLFGVWKHVTIPAKNLTDRLFNEGIGFDASNFGFAMVEKSDMVMIPDPNTAFLDPFGEYPTLSLTCNVFHPQTGKRFEQDPRGILIRTIDHISREGIADQILFGPEYEFHVLNDVRYKIAPNRITLKIDSEEGFWNSGKTGEYFVGRKRGYHRSAPFDHFFALRNHIVDQLEQLGVAVKYHHHEVGTAQLEIETNFMDALRAADATLLVKYVVRNIAHEFGYVVTFLPKPIHDEAGNGMHVHQFLKKGDNNLFAGEKVYNLSEMALSYTAGILGHSPALLAFTNPTTNSYRRLVPGFEAPTNAVFAIGNRTSAIRIPGYVKDDAKRRVEFRTIDASCNPYLAFSAMLLAGVDGILQKWDPSEMGFGPFEGDLGMSEAHPLPKTLEEAMNALERDNAFLKRWEIFPDSLLAKWVSKKREEYRLVSSIPHPVEYQLYFDL
ncbi:MAG TPA: type I glutamate--ammonia ligase [Thermotogota bacterium]|nr:type I glutamate--ammonia ligase [Thermotogota bacterium]HRW92023.1 type I glutamate--ammonia ligase [Thermotogota bacterium]